MAFTFFPFMFRERQEQRKALEAEVQVVYRDTQMVDVVDHESNLLMIPKDDIYYCVLDNACFRGVKTYITYLVDI